MAAPGRCQRGSQSSWQSKGGSQSCWHRCNSCQGAERHQGHWPQKISGLKPWKNWTLVNFGQPVLKKMTTSSFFVLLRCEMKRQEEEKEEKETEPQEKTEEKAPVEVRFKLHSFRALPSGISTPRKHPKRMRRARPGVVATFFFF